MKKLGVMAMVVAALVVESRVEALGVRPNLTAVLALAAGLRMGPYRGLLAGAGLGFLADCFTGGLVGPNVIGRTTVAYLGSFLSGGRLFVWTPVLGMIGAFLLTALDGYLVHAALSVFSSDPGEGWARVSFVQAAMNAPLGALVRPRE